MFVRINYSNGYCMCEQSEVFEVENISEAEELAEEGLMDFAESYSHVATGWDEDFESKEEESNYYKNCSYDIEEISEKEYREECLLPLMC